MNDFNLIAPPFLIFVIVFFQKYQYLLYLEKRIPIDRKVKNNPKK